MKPRYVSVGKIRSPHGLDGSVKVVSLTDIKERFEPATKFFLSPPLTFLSSLTVEKVKGKGDILYIKFKEVKTRKLAEALKGRYLQIPQSQIPQLPSGVYWIYEIIGLKCYTLEGKYLGEVKEVLKTKSNDVYVVKKGKKEILVPAIKEVVKEVDLEKGKIIISPYLGILEED